MPKQKKYGGLAVSLGSLADHVKIPSRLLLSE